MLSRDVELSLAAAFREAEVRRHEFVTLEHLLYALLHNDDGAAIIGACGGETHELRTRLESFFRDRLQTVPGESPYELEMTRTVRRLLQRVIHQARSAERDKVHAGDVLAALLLEADSHAAYFLQEQGISRVDVLEVISHGEVAPAGSPGAKPRQESRKGSPAQMLERFTTDLTARAAEGAFDPLIGRGTEVDRALQILGRRHKNSPVLVGDAGVGKTAIVEGNREPHRDRRGAGTVPRNTHHCPRSWLAARRHPVSRRLRGAHQGRDRRAARTPRRDPVHRRDPHRGRRRRHLGRHHGRLQPAQAGARQRRAALHRGHHLRGVPAPLREGSRPVAALPEDRGGGTVGGRHRADPARPPGALRGVPRGALQRARTARRRRAGGGPRPRPAPARQGDRRDRRGGVALEAARGGRRERCRRGAGRARGCCRRRHGGRRRRRCRPRPRAAPRDHRQRGGGGSGEHQRAAGGGGLQRRAPVAARPPGQAAGADLRPGRGDRPHHPRHQAQPRRPRRGAPADRGVPADRPHRRRQDRAHPPARRPARGGADPHRHERVPGEAHRVAADRRPPRLRRLRGGRLPYRRGHQGPLLRDPARRDREGPSRRVRPAAADHGPRLPHRRQRAPRRLPPHGAGDDLQRRRRRDERPPHRLRSRRDAGADLRRRGRGQAPVPARVHQPPGRHRHLPAAAARQHAPHREPPTCGTSTPSCAPGAAPAAAPPCSSPRPPTAG